MATTEEMVFYSPLRKISGKRCLSPLKANKDDSKRNTRRKTNNPVLILAQNNNKKCCAPSLLHQDQTIFDPPRRFSDDYQPDISELQTCSHPQPQHHNHLDSVFRADMELADRRLQQDPGDLSSLERCVKPEPILASPCIDGEVSTDEMTFSAKDFQTENDVSTDILGSLNSLETASIPWPSTSQGTISRRGSSATMFSTSYTSWTKPEAGHRTSENSFVPHSSILDKETCSAKPIPRSRSVRRTSKRSSCGRYLKRDSSADTSKDIDDIEDFEFDGGLDDLVHDDESTYQTRQEEMLRSAHLYPAHAAVALASPDLISSSTPEIPTPQNTANPGHAPRYHGALTTSPDLAYESLNPSADELSK